MKVLHVITNFAGSAGAETVLAQTARHSALADVLVVSLMALSQRNVDLAGPNVRCLSLGAASLGRMALSPVALARLLRRERPQAMICWMYHAMVVGALARQLAGTKVPLLWNVRQSLDDPAALSTSVRVAVALSRRLSRMPTAIVFASHRARDLHLRSGFVNPACLVLPNGVEHMETVPARGPARRFGVAARLNPQKDYPTLFRAIVLARRSIPDASFVLAGAGVTADNPAIDRMMAEAGVDRGAVTLLGQVADMVGFYAGIDALILSSRTEGFPNVVVEAMAHGRPVVTTDVGDAADIVGDTGLVVRPGEPAALAEAIGRFHRMPAGDFARLATRAQARARDHFGLPAVVECYDTLIRSVSAPPA